MAHKKPKKLKMRRKPKASASIEVKENWIKDKKTLDKENVDRLAAWKAAKTKSKKLSSQISGM